MITLAITDSTRPTDSTRCMPPTPPATRVPTPVRAQPDARPDERASVGLSAAAFLGIEPLAPRRLERRHLRIKRLCIGRDPRVSHQHEHSHCASTCASYGGPYFKARTFLPDDHQLPVVRVEATAATGKLLKALLLY